MPAIVRIHETEIDIVSYNGQRVLSCDMIDRVHARPAGTAYRNFKSNCSHFSEGKHFHHVMAVDEIRRLGFSPKPDGIILLTERGYLLLRTFFRDARAWKVC